MKNVVKFSLYSRVTVDEISYQLTLKKGWC